MSVPPVAACRIQFFLTDQRMEWSEVYWSANGDLEAVLAQAEIAAGIRVRMLPQGTQLPEIRVSNDNVFRDSEVSFVYANWGRGNPDQRIYNGAILACGPPAPPTDVLRLREENNAIYRRITYLSGMPESVVVDQGNFNPAHPGCAAWADEFQAWQSWLIGNGWGFVVTRNPPSNTVLVVNAVLNVNPQFIDITLAAAAPWITVGRTFAIHNARNLHPCIKINGRHVATAVAGGGMTITFPNPSPGDALCYIPGTGTAVSVDRQFAAINRVIPDGFAIHKRGAAELAPRGRSRSRKLLGT